MRTSRPAKPPPVPTQQNNSSRVAIQLLEAELASLPVGPEAAAILLERATCPLRFVWKDLGPDFWPRWLRTAYCPQPPPGTPSCSWPPGMACAPGPHRHLHVLRWHCRLRKNSKRKKNDNNVWGSAEKRRSMMGEDQEGGGGKYRCLWVKVPYPVAEDCICSCA
ncbi:hypothetical protein AAG570_013490 [Ranatra chinensis]|uniref:Noggin n=1 Tax=Ranatra chinensis TaxID=642074 RepID=A0ABD0YCB5_9HEMI